MADVRAAVLVVRSPEHHRVPARRGEALRGTSSCLVLAGPGNARNVGLQLATGDYIWFIDGDDMAAEGAVKAITQRLAEDLPDVLLIDYESLYPDGRSAASPGAELLRDAPAGTFTLAEQPQLIQLTMTSWSKVISRGF